MKAERPVRIFVSYAHEDGAWRNTLFRQNITTPSGIHPTWTDDRIAPGAAWDAAIADALEQATVAILLVSRHFLASVYIARKELQTVLERRLADGLKVVWIPIGPLDPVEQGVLASIQAACPLKKALPMRPSGDPQVVERVVDEVQYWIRAAIDPVGVPLMRELDDRYDPFVGIAQTDSSFVYRTHDRHLDRPVVVKVLACDEHLDEFAQSARDAARISDEPYFVKLYDAVLDGRRPYCLMQAIDGPSLREWIEADGRRPLATVIRILSKLVRALRAAHALGVPYGNLRPSNVVLAGDRNPYVLPMGRRVNDCRGRPLLDRLERRSPGAEELSYLAPELFDEELETVSPQLTDQYMLGLVAHELLTGELPPVFDGAPAGPATLADIRARGSAAFRELPPASVARPDCSEALAAIIRRATSRLPEHRYASLDELLIDVRRQEDVMLARVRESFNRCLAEQQAAGRNFFEASYRLFFERRKDAEPLFKQMGPAQYENLQNAVVGLFAFYEQERVREPNEPNVLTQVAQRHDRGHLKIGLDFYAPFTESLIDTACGLQDAPHLAFDPRCRADAASCARIRAAWHEVLRPGVEYMKSRY